MIFISGLHKFKLAESSLQRLGKTRIFVLVYVGRTNERRLFKLPPQKRKIRMREVKKRNYRVLEKHWPGEKPELIGSIKSPAGLSGWIAARDFSKFYKLPVKDIWIEKIEGRDPIVKRGLSPNYFGVKARYAIQIEGLKKGLQTFEDRTLLVRARTVGEAEKIIKKRIS